MLTNGTIITEGKHFTLVVIGKTEDSYIMQNVLNGEQSLLCFSDLDLHFVHTIIKEN